MSFFTLARDVNGLDTNRIVVKPYSVFFFIFWIRIRIGYKTDTNTDINRVCNSDIVTKLTYYLSNYFLIRK